MKIFMFSELFRFCILYILVDNVLKNKLLTWERIRDGRK